MSSPPRARFHPQPPSTASSSSPSQSSTASPLPLPKHREHQDQAQPKPQFTEFSLHSLLEATQEPISELQLHSRILWDVREDPLIFAQFSEQLGTMLAPAVLAAYATNPPVTVLKVVCEYPTRWEVFIHASAPGRAGGAGPGMRNTFPVYPPPPSTMGHARSSSASPRRPATNIAPVPAKPVIPNISLPGSRSKLTAATDLTHAHANASPRKEGITIGDLLLGIYNHLHTVPMHRDEFEALPKKQRDRIAEAYHKRQKMSPTSPVAPGGGFTFPPMRGVMTAASTSSSVASSSAATSSAVNDVGAKKVDTLLKTTWFAGMSVVPEQELTVILSLKRPN